MQTKAEYDVLYEVESRGNEISRFILISMVEAVDHLTAKTILGSGLRARGSGLVMVLIG